MASSKQLLQDYSPASTEKWYQYWMDNGFFKSVPDEREPYTIVIPPPNVTGMLHMGHMLNNTIQDVLIRRARMLGYNACWVPGTDHASIATEAKVVAKLANEGINKHDLSRDEFMKHAWEWKEKHGGVILQQLRRLGASCDWDRTRFTMEDDLSDAVHDTFLDLYDKGLIYRGYRMVNWDPVALTAVSDEEVDHVEEPGKLYHVRYKVVGEENWVTIATTRPETILGDTAICIHPEDKRYVHLHGKQIAIPFTDRTVPIILDDYVEMEFGTGCLKVTPAHDPNDKVLGEKHNLEVIDILNNDGTLNEYGNQYAGLDRFEVRKKIAEDLEKEGFLVKVEDYEHKVGRSERTKAVIEPKLSIQWFVKMGELAKPALENVLNNEVEFFPAKFKNTYRYWMENVKDWCISRQLWWGQRIPAFYYGNGLEDYVIAKTKDTALDLAKEKSGNTNLGIDDLRQDEDVVDTWFSSWLWPISVFDGFKDPDNPDINYYYPTNALVTGHDIIFFWVARMIMAGYEYKKEKPFSNVYFTGMVRDQQRRKMSKQLGNSPDPIGLIEQYGADGVRVGMLLSSPAGNDLLFDDQLCNQGRNFANKIWNAARLIQSWEVSDSIEQPEASKIANDWITAKFAVVVEQINDHYNKFRISDALMATYKFIWDDFCSWYLESIKPPYQQPVDQITFDQAIEHLENVLRIVHPFMPFISEDLWHNIRKREVHESLIVAQWPKPEPANKELIKAFERAMEVITQVRTIRKKHQIKPKEELELWVNDHESSGSGMDPVIEKLGYTASVAYTEEKIENTHSFLIGANEYFVPVNETVDKEETLKRLKEELSYQQGFLNSVMKKLGNERFVQNAPEQVVAVEQKKKSDAEAKIKLLQEQMEALG